MNKEIQHLIKLYKSAYEGDPWFGRSINKILAEIDAPTAMQKPNDQHSILELLYHMINWREFTISRLEQGKDGTAHHFDNNDWGQYDHTDHSLWKKGLKKLETTQQRLVELLEELPEELLTKKVADRNYDVRYLLYGVLEHDIYHIGQIAYVKKFLTST